MRRRLIQHATDYGSKVVFYRYLTPAEVLCINKNTFAVYFLGQFQLHSEHLMGRTQYWIDFWDIFTKQSRALMFFVQFCRNRLSYLCLPFHHPLAVYASTPPNAFFLYCYLFMAVGVRY